MESYANIRQTCKDHWFNRYVNDNGYREEKKNNLIKEVKYNYTSYLAELMSKRQLLYSHKTELKKNYVSVKLDLKYQEQELAFFDFAIDNAATFARLAAAACSLVPSAVKASRAILKALKFKDLIRISNEFYPGINEFKPVINVARREFMYKTIKDVTKRVGLVLAEETFLELLNKMTKILDPSQIARGYIKLKGGQTPEEATRQIRSQIKSTFERALNFSEVKIQNMDKTYNLVNLEYKELLKYIKAFN